MAPELVKVIKVPPPISRLNPCRYWCFTIWDKDGSNGSNISRVLGNLGYYHMGYEEAPTTGKGHWQGLIQLRKKGRINEMVPELYNGNHWEPAKGSRKQNMDYTGKYGKVVTNMDIVRDPLDTLTPYKWQQDILELIKGEPDDRTIHWYWEPTGNVGKTALIKSICLKRDDVIMVDGKAGDAKYIIAGMNKKPKVIFMNIVRTKENFISYEAIESIKDGIFVSTKYESKMVVMNSPHFIVLANFEPAYGNMSQDRWNVVDISGYTD